ncbi:tryptophan synthase subunit beta [Teredinibacter turnerae]|uniref:tryptophan synthase subunit beta n=1 Tax=Teredinibacter turnerae TaxID=2426 RepID=UPI0003717A1B|nr:tryptophan synthase subunit beta [Teredinibacter turnerae]
MISSEQGLFGEFGGRYVPEILRPALCQLEDIYQQLRSDENFWQEYLQLTQEFSGRPTPLTPLPRLSESLGGAKIWLKREDLNHSGAHKINNVLGQALLVKRMGKQRIIAETGAGQHGLATAIIAARMGLQATIYMGSEDVERQYSNVFWMRQLGAEVVPVSHGSCTLKDALDEALRDWAASVDDTHYVLGTACGPAPFPELVTYFQRVISQEIRAQAKHQISALPNAVVACVGGGSNALGAFCDFLDEPSVRLLGVEAGGRSQQPGQHSIRLQGDLASPGIAQGYKTLFLQNRDGQLGETHSIAAGLDYVGVSPVLADLVARGRVDATSATDSEVTHAFQLLMRYEGIIPALESSHALAGGFALAKKMQPHEHVVINLSGRGDKDIFNIAQALPQQEWLDFLKREVTRTEQRLRESAKSPNREEQYVSNA